MVVPIKIHGRTNGIGWPGEEKKLVFDAVAAPETLQPGINHMSIVVDVTPKQKSIELKENFFAPFETPVKSSPDSGTNKK